MKRHILRAALLPVELLATLAVVVIGAPLWLLSWNRAARLGEIYGRCAYFLWPKARRAGMINLRRAYGSAMDLRTARSWTAEVFGSLGRSIAEGVQFARRYKSKRDPAERIRAEDETLEAQILADPRPKIFATAHLGSWEVGLGAVSRRIGPGGAVIIRRIDNPFLNALVRRLRLHRAEEWIEKRGASAEALRRLRAGESVALLADENGGPRGVFVDFFGRPASAHKTPAVLSALTGSPIVVGAAVRRENEFLFRLAVIEPRPVSRRADAELEIRRLTGELAQVLERWIRAEPRQWRWIHWRWRSRPDGSEEAYRSADVDECFRQAVSGTIAELHASD